MWYLRLCVCKNSLNPLLVISQKSEETVKNGNDCASLIFSDHFVDFTSKFPLLCVQKGKFHFAYTSYNIIKSKCNDFVLNLFYIIACGFTAVAKV